MNIYLLTSLSSLLLAYLIIASSKIFDDYDIGRIIFLSIGLFLVLLSIGLLIWDGERKKQ